MPRSPDFLDQARELSGYIRQRGVRVAIDEKFDMKRETRRHCAKLHGIPVHIELSAKEVVPVLQRHTGKLIEIPLVNLSSSIPRLLIDQQLDMLESATERMAHYAES